MNYETKAVLTVFAKGLLTSTVAALAGIGLLVVGAMMIDPEPPPAFVLGLYALAATIGVGVELAVRSIRFHSAKEEA